MVIGFSSLDWHHSLSGSNSNRWLLFDPDKEWYQSNEEQHLTTATNQPIKDKKIFGKVIDCGLTNQAYQNDQ